MPNLCQKQGPVARKSSRYLRTLEPAEQPAEWHFVRLEEFTTWGLEYQLSSSLTNGADSRMSSGVT